MYHVVSKFQNQIGSIWRKKNPNRQILGTYLVRVMGGTGGESGGGTVCARSHEYLWRPTIGVPKQQSC
jgi:hypothetical protein